MTVTQINENTPKKESYGEPGLSLGLHDFVEIYQARWRGSNYEQNEYVKQLADREVDEIAKLVVDMIENEESAAYDLSTSSLVVDDVLSTVLRIKSSEPDDNRLRSTQMRLRKEFILSVMRSYVDRVSLGMDESEAKALAGKIQDVFVSHSPNMTDYIGGLDDRIDVAVAGQAIPYMDKLVWGVKEEAMQSVTFSREPERLTESLVKRVASVSPAEQLQTLKFYESMSHHATNASYGENAASVFVDVFAQLRDVDGNALTAIVASQYYEDVVARYNNYVPTGSHSAELTRYEAFGLNRRISLPDDWRGLYRPARIASDVVATRDGYGVVRQVAQLTKELKPISEEELNLANVCDFLGNLERADNQWDFYDSAMTFLGSRLDGDEAAAVRKASTPYELRDVVGGLLREYNVGLVSFEKNDFTKLEDVFDGDSEKVELLQIVHTPEIREMLEKHIGVDLSEIPLAMQARLLGYMTHRSMEEFSRVSEVAGKIQQEHGSTADFFEAFLATEFGDDFGNAILDIADHVPPEKTARVCELVNSLRRKSHEYADIFASIDPALAEQTEKALSERITDVLVSLREVAVQGSLKEDVSPARNTPEQGSAKEFSVEVQSLDEALGILADLEKTFTAQQAIIHAEDLRINRVNDDTSQFTLYRFVSETTGNMLLYVRPEGGHGYDSAVEYGNRAGVEASISFVVNPLDPHALILPKSSEGVSIRFDREGRAVGEAPNSPDRNPTREDGMMSVDVSSIMGPETSAPVRIGRFVAAGNLIRSRNEGTADSLHHNSNYFDQQKYGSAKGFAELARGVIEQVEMLRSDRNRRKLSAHAVARAA